MNPTETTLGQELDPSLDPVASSTLPITAGDVAGVRETAEAEHDWPASLFILLTRLSVFGLAIGALVMCWLALADDSMPAWRGLGIAALMAAGVVLQSTLARNVERFTRWGWYGAMGELAFVTLAKVNLLLRDPLGEGIGAAFGIVIDVLWISYFWERRADFGVDLDE